MLILIDTKAEVLEVLSPIKPEELSDVFEKIKPLRIRNYFLSVRDLIGAPVFTENDLDDINDMLTNKTQENEPEVVVSSFAGSDQPKEKDIEAPKPPTEK